MNTKTLYIIIGALILVILVGAGFYVGNYIQTQAYQQGFNDAQILINQQVLNQLQSQGFVQFSFIVENQTRTINLVPYQDLK